ncbi:uncharacterized protein LOC142563811 isoform X6 [Dermacentor variabilis]|uniref:uncharacterized protein LOC142563811 isoform X6 n=1 Tax=Dermacentor variabilis TaxID=34621 RepID=UPI003F5B5F13
MRHQGLIFFIVSMEKTGILILFQYTCMCIGVSARKAGKKRREPVGQNITVKVRAYYDNSFKKNKNETEVKAHFDFIFSEIKKKLNKRLVTLNFSVKSAVEDKYSGERNTPCGLRLHAKYILHEECYCDGSADIFRASILPDCFKSDHIRAAWSKHASFSVQDFQKMNQIFWKCVAKDKRN